MPGEIAGELAGDGVGPLSATNRRVTMMMAGVAVIGCAYVGLVDPESAASPFPACPFKAMTGFDCPGCGLTRSLHALLNFRPLDSLDHNPLLVMGLVASAIAMVVVRRARRRGRPARFTMGRSSAIFLAVALSAFWVVRNVPLTPFDWLASGLAGA